MPNDAAAEAFDAAEVLLAEHGWDGDKAATDKLLELMVDGRALLYLARDEKDRALSALEAARPVLEAMGRPTRRYSFYTQLATIRAREHRFRIDEQVIANRRLGLRAAEESADEPSAPWATDWRDQGGALSDDPESDIADVGPA